MPRFFALPFPYSDCAVISFKDSTLAMRGAGKLLTALRPHGLAVHTGGYFGAPECVIVLSGDMPIKTSEGHTRIFSGFGRVHGRFVFGQHALPPAATDISGEIGQFTYFNIRPGLIEADSDLFGHGLLFASQQRDCAVISNRQHLQTLIISALGYPLELHRQAALTQLFSNMTFFSPQNMSHDMLAKGVTQVPVDKRASLRNGVLHLQAKRTFEDCMVPGSYEQLVDEGVHDIIENTKCVLENKSFRTVVVDLSGGKDSRMVFGAMLHHPAWRDRVALNTNDMPGSEDLSIACGIANMFGARFYEGSTLQQEAFSGEQNLTLWRSYFSGLYHRLGASAWTYAGRNTEAITLSGGNGETLRTFWCGVVGRYMEDGDTEASFVARMVKSAGLWRAVDRRHEAEIADYTCGILKNMPGRSLKEKLEAHYLYFRNRSHFGLRGFSCYHDKPTWFPLMSAALLKAAHSLPFEQREAGRLVRDITRKLHPILSQIRYDGGNSFDGLPKTAYRAEDAELDIALNTDRSKWESATAIAAERLRAGPAGLKPTMVWGQWPGFVEAEAIKAHEETKEVSATYREIIDDRYIDLLRTEFKSSSIRAVEMASRLFSIRDSLIA